MMRLRPVVMWALCSALSACAGGGDSRASASTTGLGGDDADQASDSTGPSSISASVSATASASETSDSTSADTDSTGDTTPPTTTPVDDTTADAGSTSTGTAEEDGSTSTGAGSTTTGSTTGIDLSGWTIVQTDSDRTFDIPAGTVLPEGGVLIVARDTGQDAFETYWGVALGADVVFLDGGDNFPNINGGETYALRDDDSATIDGPSPALVVEGALDRIDPESEGPSAWTATPATVGTPTPGTSAEPSAGFTGAFVSEASDAIGIGNFVYEFVEVRAF